MGVLGQFYGDDLHNVQTKPPTGNGYLDFVISEIHGLRVRRALERRSKAAKVIGTFCLYVPEEILLAADAVSVGSAAGADIGPPSRAVLPRNTLCSDQVVLWVQDGGALPLRRACDLVIGETNVRRKTKATSIFNEYKRLRARGAHTKSNAAAGLWRSEMDRLVAKVEDLTGADHRRFSTPRVEVVNARRKVLDRLNRLRAADPAPISGRDALLVNQSPSTTTRSVSPEDRRAV